MSEVKFSAKVNKTTRAALVKSKEYKAALYVLAGGKAAKYTECLALYLKPQGATSKEIMEYLQSAGHKPEPMLNCWRRAALSEYAEPVEQVRTGKGKKQLKAYALVLTEEGRKKLVKELAKRTKRKK